MGQADRGASVEARARRVKTADLELAVAAAAPATFPHARPCPAPRQAQAVVVSVAHLDDDERALVLGVLLEEVLSWVPSRASSSCPQQAPSRALPSRPVPTRGRLPGSRSRAEPFDARLHLPSAALVFVKRVGAQRERALVGRSLTLEAEPHVRFLRLLRLWRLGQQT
jgi:hypothetical protein